MQESELEYYERIGNWNFKEIKYEVQKLTNWDFYHEIKKHTNKKSLCLDLGTGGGENVLKKYPKVGMIIATDFSRKMLKTAKENQKKYPRKNVKFIWMNNLEMKFPEETFDLISARHTKINAKQVYNCLAKEGIIIIEGIDKKDCWEIKEIFKRGQAYNDGISIAEKDYLDLKEAGFNKIKKVEILENEYYKTKEDLMALLLKTPILNDLRNENSENKKKIEMNLFEKYVDMYTTKNGILLKRKLYGIVATKK